MAAGASAGTFGCGFARPHDLTGLHSVYGFLYVRDVDGELGFHFPLFKLTIRRDELDRIPSVSAAEGPLLEASATRRFGFRGSIPRPHLPLSTLRDGPCDPPHMTRGQDDWLDLSCMIFSFHYFLPVIWRFYPADGVRIVT
jgi:hypothetical protein